MSIKLSPFRKSRWNSFLKLRRPKRKLAIAKITEFQIFLPHSTLILTKQKQISLSDHSNPQPPNQPISKTRSSNQQLIFNLWFWNAKEKGIFDVRKEPQETSYFSGLSHNRLKQTTKNKRKSASEANSSSSITQIKTNHQSNETFIAERKRMGVIYLKIKTEELGEMSLWRVEILSVNLEIYVLEE